MKKILSSPLFSKFPEIAQATSTKEFGPLSFVYNKSSNSVIIDRVKFLDTLGLDANQCILIGEQNHTDNIIQITEKHENHGLFHQSEQIPNIDGMITDRSNTHLIIYTADCMPISFYDPVKKVIGIVHSGWRGTVKEISKKMIRLFIEKYGSELSDILVNIGPSIGPCCYDVRNPEQIQLFSERYNNIIQRDDKIYIDLWDSIHKDLIGAGINPIHIENPRICTACNNHIYASHRKDNPNTKTNLTIISMK